MGPLQALIERAHRSDDEEFYLIHAEGCQTVGELILRVQRQQNSCDSFKKTSKVLRENSLGFCEGISPC